MLVGSSVNVKKNRLKTGVRTFFFIKNGPGSGRDNECSCSISVSKDQILTQPNNTKISLKILKMSLSSNISTAYEPKLC